MQLLKVQRNAIKKLQKICVESKPELPRDYALLPVSRLTQKATRRVMNSASQYPVEERPKTRAECEVGAPGAMRPCPYVSCKHHTYLSVSETDGRVTVNYPTLHPWELATRTPAEIVALTDEERTAITKVEGHGALLPSCILDIVDDLGGTTLEICGMFMNRTRERVRQIELSATETLKAAIAADGLIREDL